MNKSLVAFATLGAVTSAALAQSSVTVYGRIDQTITLQDPGQAAAASTGGRLGKSVVALRDASGVGKGGSRIGLRGQEDLGDGLKAIFQLEAGLSPDTGVVGNSTTLTPSPGSSFFNRQAWAGLSHSSYGELRLGRVETLTRENNSRFNSVAGEREISIVENLGASSTQSLRPLFQNFGTRVDNAISYRSPVYGGLRVSAILALGESIRSTPAVTTPSAGVTRSSVNRAAQYRGLGITYAAGPFEGGLTYEELNGGSANGAYNEAFTLGGSYDFGIAKLHAAYQTTDDSGSQFAPTVTVVNTNTATTTVTPFVRGLDHQAWNLGLSVPYGKFLFKTQYTGSTIDRLAGGDFDQSKYGVTAEYALSKRTWVYVAFTERGGDFKETYARKNEYSLGFAHTF